MTKLTA